jgi:hypothetical protein
MTRPGGIGDGQARQPPVEIPADEAAQTSACSPQQLADEVERQG